MLPEEFLDRMGHLLGDEYEAFVNSFTGDRYQALRVNSLKVSGKKINLPFDMTDVSWAKNGYYYTKNDQPGKHPYHEAGVYYIQEPSAMAPVTLLDPQPGDYILDLCAAPGGKSTQIAALMDGEGILISNEIHPARAKILSENIERMGIKNACVTNETPQHLTEFFPEYFDRILVDAPCSGEGMFRKNETACEEWSIENVELCGDRQDEILDCAAAMLKPGGRIVYSTCTFAPRENEGTISRFIKRHPEYKIAPIDKELLKISGGDGKAEYVDEPCQGLENTLRLWPHKIKGEGHYAAVLERCDPAEGYKGYPKNGIQMGISEKELVEYRAFERENLRIKLQGDFIRFGENLYLIPENLPSVKGLKVLRPGLQIGTLKKNRFEPSHAFALYLNDTQVINTYNLNSESEDARNYLNGLTFPAEGNKGWYLITVDGYSLGWGKLAGGIMKNHYPKGLRKNAY